MQVNTTELLMSLRNEADRQCAFYERKGNEGLRDFWSDLGSMTDEALRSRASLLIERRERVNSPLPIKGCEQVQQLPNINVIKALQ